MRKPRKILSLLAILLLSSAAYAENWALLVGVDTYQSREISPLRYAVSDVKAMAQALKATGNFPANNIFLMTDKGSERDLATGTNIIWRLTWLAKNMSAGDTLVFYFSGHGMEKDGQTYLLSYDSDIANDVTLKRSAVRMSDLRDLTKLMKASRVISFMDACRNDPVAGKSVGGSNALSKGMAKDLALVSDTSERPNMMSATFYSCSPGERSWEDSQNSHGYFSYYVVEGLLGKAAGPNGAVTINSLESYLAKTVPDAVNRALGRQQVPWVKREGAGGGDFALASTSDIRRDEAETILASKEDQTHSSNPGAGLALTMDWPLIQGNYWKYDVVTEPANEYVKPYSYTESVIDVEKRDGNDFSRIEKSFENLDISSQSYFQCWGEDWMMTQSDPNSPPKQTGIKRRFTLGDSWTYKLQVAGTTITITYTVDGLEDIKVPAGQFQTVKITSLSQSTHGTQEQTLWFAPRVGLIQLVQQNTDASVTTTRLVDFKV